MLRQMSTPSEPLYDLSARLFLFVKVCSTPKCLFGIMKSVAKDFWELFQSLHQSRQQALLYILQIVQ